MALYYYNSIILLSQSNNMHVGIGHALVDRRIVNDLAFVGSLSGHVSKLEVGVVNDNVV